MTLTLSDFDFDLPPELIAQSALEKRSASRLLEVDTSTSETLLHDRQFDDIANLLRPGDLLVCNDTKVIKARLLGHKESGGAVEVLIERVLTEPDGSHRRAIAQIRASKSPKPGTRLLLGDATNPLVVTMGERVEPFFTLHFDGDAYALLEQHGRLPLPPYITHDPNAYDETRYQTVFAKHLGAVAAPTAGLHFDDALFAQLAARGVQRSFVTLHVGAGTFQPVRVENLAEHKMHSEWFSISSELAQQVAQTKANGGRVIAVGTTSLRALESAADAHGVLQVGERDTNIFITPGYQFKVVDALITNFHLPKSTLLMLVSAFVGTAAIKQAYAHAIAQQYRFFSYGDAMFLQRSI